MTKMLWLLVVVVAGLCPRGVAAQKQRMSDSHRPDPYDYPVTVHVAHARLIGAPNTMLHLDAVIDGKSVELETNAGALLHTGDYKARLVSDDEKKSGWFSKSYDILFSDGTHVIFSEVAESE